MVIYMIDIEPRPTALGSMRSSIARTVENAERSGPEGFVLDDNG